MDNPSGDAGGGNRDKRVQLVEVGVFLFLIGPSLGLSFFLTHQGNIGFTLLAVATMIRDVSLVTLILYFLWRNKEPVSNIGWTLKHVWKEIALGIVLFVPMFVGLSILLKGLGFSVPTNPLPSLQPTRSVAGILVALALVIVVALAEESIFRGYLMLRFRAVTGSPLWSVLLSAFVFSLGHGYEGSAGLIGVGAIGVVLGAVYAWRGSLVAPITMHFLQDFISIVIVSLLAWKPVG